MRGVGATAAAVACGEFRRFLAHGDANGAGGHMHMLDRAGSVGGGRTQDGRRRDLIAHEVDAATRGCGSQALPAGGVFTPSPLATPAGGVFTPSPLAAPA